MKKPSVKGMSNMGYLGRFANDKWLAKGHNDIGNGEAPLEADSGVDSDKSLNNKKDKDVGREKKDKAVYIESISGEAPDLNVVLRQRRKIKNSTTNKI